MLPMRRSHSDSTISSPSPPHDLVMTRTALAVRNIPLTSARQAPEAQSLHATCASSTTSSTFVRTSNAGRSAVKASLRRHPSPPQSVARCPSTELSSSVKSSKSHPYLPESLNVVPGKPLSRFSTHDAKTAQQAQRLDESMITKAHNALCHPALCCILLILHIVSLLPPWQLRALAVPPAIPATHTLWITLHLISFCSNLLVIQLDPQRTPSVADDGLSFPRPDPSRLAGLAYTIPGAAAVLLAALQLPLRLLVPSLATVSVGSYTAPWRLWLEMASQVAAALLNSAYALSVAAVPLAGTLSRLTHMLALGAGATALLALLPAVAQPPLWLVFSVWLVVRPPNPCSVIPRRRTCRLTLPGGHEPRVATRTIRCHRLAPAQCTAPVCYLLRGGVACSVRLEGCRRAWWPSAAWRRAAPRAPSTAAASWPSAPLASRPPPRPCCCRGRCRRCCAAGCTAARWTSPAASSPECCCRCCRPPSRKPGRSASAASPCTLPVRAYLPCPRPSPCAHTTSPRPRVSGFSAAHPRIRRRRCLL